MSERLTIKQFAELLWDRYAKDHLIIINPVLGRIIISDIGKITQEQYEKLWWITFEQTEHGYRCGSDVVVERDRQQFIDSFLSRQPDPDWKTYLTEQDVVYTWERLRQSMLDMYSESDFD